MQLYDEYFTLKIEVSDISSDDGLVSQDSESALQDSEDDSTDQD